MKRVLSILIAMLMVVGMFAIVSSAEEELPEGATKLDYAGYIHDYYFVILAGDNMTVGELTALGIGEEKDMNYFAIIVVDEYDTIIEVNTTLGRPDGVKTETVCPENGYIIGLNGNKEGYKLFEEVHVGDIVELFNIDLDEYRGKEGSVALENAGFIVHDESGDSGEVEYYLSLPITAENGVAVNDDTDTVLVDGQLYYFPGEADAERVIDSEEYNLRYSYIVICDENGYAIEAGNNLVFASQDTSYQNDVTVPAGGFAFSFYYNETSGNSNQDLFDIYNLDLMGQLPIYNETIAVTNTTYQFVVEDGLLCVIKNAVEDESSEEESSEEESSEPEEESSVVEEESKEESKEASTAPTTSTATSTDNTDDGDSSLGLIIGIIVAVVAVVVIVVVVVVKKKK